MLLEVAGGALGLVSLGFSEALDKSGVLSLESEKRRQQFQKLVLGLASKSLLKSLLGSWLNGPRCLCPSPVGYGANSRSEAISVSKDSHEQAGVTSQGAGGRPKTN